MTIAAGFRCSDGVVLCADTQMTYPGLLKFPGSKIRLFNRMGCQPAFALAGQVDFSNMAIHRLAMVALDAERKGLDIHDAVTKECVAIHREYFPLYSPSERLELSLLFAMRVKKDTPVHLFEIRGPVIAPITTYGCIGSGTYFGTSIAQTLYKSTLTVQQVAQMCVYLLFAVKKNVDGCGGKSQIVCLSDSGGWSTLADFDRVSSIESREEDYEVFEDSLRHILLEFTDYDVPSRDFDKRLSDFSAEISERRSKRLKDYAKREEDWFDQMQEEAKRMATDDEP